MRFNLLLLLSLSLSLFAGDYTDLILGQQFEIKSKVMGETRTIQVNLPAGYNEGKIHYPVLYMTDAEAKFFHTAGTMDFLGGQGLIPEMILVAVTNTNRSLDLTPTDRDGDGAHGGADRFLTFFREELFPAIKSRYRTNEFRAFAGHSYGGLFAFHAFIHHNEMFHAYISVSPSLWWVDQLLLKQAQEFFKGKPTLTTSLYMAVGGDENKDMRGSFAAMAQFLETQKQEGFRFVSKELANKDHGTVVLPAHLEGLEFLFEGWKPKEPFKSLAAAEAHFAALGKRMKMSLPVPEKVVNVLGYGALGDKDFTTALTYFRHNVAHYPESANPYDSLGEALEKSGDLKGALEQYTLAFERAEKYKSPQLNLFKVNLDRLKGQLSGK